MDDRKSTEGRLNCQMIFINRLLDWITLNIKRLSSGDVKSLCHSCKFLITVKYVHGKFSLFFTYKIKLHFSRSKEVNYQVSNINQESKWKLVHLMQSDKMFIIRHIVTIVIVFGRSLKKTPSLVSRHVITNNIYHATRVSKWQINQVSKIIVTFECI